MLTALGRMLPRNKKKKRERDRGKEITHTPPEVLTDAFECIVRFICLAENLTIIINVCRIPIKQISWGGRGREAITTSS